MCQEQKKVVVDKKIKRDVVVNLLSSNGLSAPPAISDATLLFLVLAPSPKVWPITSRSDIQGTITMAS